MALPASATQQQHFVVVWQQSQEQQQHPRVVGRNMAATAAASASATLAPQQHVQRWPHNSHQILSHVHCLHMASILKLSHRLELTA